MPVVMTVHVETDVIEGALFDVDLEHPHRSQIRTDVHTSGIPAVVGDVNAYSGRIIQFLMDFVHRSGVSSDLAAIALVHPGLIDSAKGEVISSGRFRITNVPIAKIVSDALGVDAFVFHDGPCLAVGEVKYGASRSETAKRSSSGQDAALASANVLKNFLYIIVGEGVGSCIFIDGRHYSGASFNAGDLGHIMVDDFGPMCPACHRPGCLETLTARHWIAQDILSRFQRHQRARGTARQDSAFNRSLAFYTDPSNITVDQIAMAAREGNEFVTPAIERAADRLGFGVALVMDYLNPELIIFGGELMDKVDMYYELTLRAAEARCLPIAWARTSCRRASLGRRAEYWGAMDLALERMRAALVASRSHTERKTV